MDTWKETTAQERNRRIWEEELDRFVPESVLDFHVHVFPEGCLLEGEPFSCGGHALPSYGCDELAADLEAALPGRRHVAVVFGVPLPRYDQRRMDEYVGEKCDDARFFGLRLFDPLSDRPETLERDLAAGRFFGIKPYPDYVRKQDTSDAEIVEMLPAWAMEIVDALGLLVMLHIPRRGRLADPLNQRQIPELCNSYPRARIVLAHAGRAYFLKNIIGFIEPLRDLPNLYFDLAMVQNWEVLEYCFKETPAEKLLFGTDIPIALAPGKSIEINDQYTYVTPVPWELSIHDAAGRIVFTSFLYEELRAIRKAVARLDLPRAWVEGLFFGNGMALLERAAGASAVDRRSNP